MRSPCSILFSLRGLIVSLFLIACCLGNEHEASHQWPHWRGPGDDSRMTDPRLPLRWDDQSIAWRTTIPGVGQSTPIVWANRIFLTSADEDGRNRYVHGIDRKTGKIAWSRTIPSPPPAVKHNMNSYAAASCATDGEYVVSFFGRAGVHCFDVEGNPLWSRNDLGAFAGPWGTAASPLLMDNLVIQNCDADENAYLIAFDKKTGKTVWKVARDDYRGWSTPFLIETKERSELILNGHRGLRAYDPLTGQELWFCQSFNGRGAPTPIYNDDKLIALNGKPGDIYAVRPGGEGDVTDTHMAWHTPRGGRDIPSPAVAGNFILAVGLRGVASCYDLKTGKELWKKRLGGIFTASPLVINEKFMVHNEVGEVFVIEPDQDFVIHARNQLSRENDELFHASTTPHAGQLLFRSNRALYCIGR